MGKNENPENNIISYLNKNSSFLLQKTTELLTKYFYRKVKKEKSITDLDDISLSNIIVNRLHCSTTKKERKKIINLLL